MIFIFFPIYLCNSSLGEVGAKTSTLVRLFFLES